LTDFKAKINKSKINKIRSIIIIKQIQNMNLMLNMKDINKILAKIESYVWEKNVISDPLLYRHPLLLRQLKNNMQ
jgi:hypothetical protein